MKTIIEAGTIPLPTKEHVWEAKCPNCKTKFTASGDSVYTASYSGKSSTTCPKCEKLVILSGAFVGNEVLWITGAVIVVLALLFIKSVLPR